MVHGEARIEYAFAEGREFNANAIGNDPATDLAAVRIGAYGLVAAPLGDSGALRVGQLMVTLGSSFGLTNKATTGVVSALGPPIHPLGAAALES